MVELHVNDNQLTSLTVEIGNLTNLNVLFLHSNNLTSLPAEVCDLQKTGTRIIMEYKVSNTNVLDEEHIKNYCKNN